MQCIVEQPHIYGAILTAIEARLELLLEARRTDHGDVEVGSGRCEDRGLVSGEVEVRVGEIGADSVVPCWILRIPSPIVIKGRDAIDHLWRARVSSLLRAGEDAIVIDVNLQRHWIVWPWHQSSVPDAANDSKCLASEHLRNDLTTDFAIGIGGIDGSTWWHVEVATILHSDSPMGVV